MRLLRAWQGTSCESRGGGGEQTGGALCAVTLDLEPSGSSLPACHGPPAATPALTPFSQRLHVSWCLLCRYRLCSAESPPCPRAALARDTRQPLPCKSLPSGSLGQRPVTPSARTHAASLLQNREAEQIRARPSHEGFVLPSVFFVVVVFLIFFKSLLGYVFLVLERE